MKVIHFLAMDNGGAGIAAVRYHKLMQEMGIYSTLYVKNKTNLDDDSIVRLITANERNRKTIKSFIKRKLSNLLKKISPDIADEGKAKGFLHKWFLRTGGLSQSRQNLL